MLKKQPQMDIILSNYTLFQVFFVTLSKVSPLYADNNLNIFIKTTLS